MSFKDKWLAAVERKNSVLCAGLDPADYDMGRGEHGLPSGVSKRDWSLQYIEAVAPFCAAVKPNMQYWAGEEDLAALGHVISLAKSLDLVVIQDGKAADIGETNDAGFYHGVRRGADAVTIAPYAENITEAATQLHTRGIGGITMCLMSNKEYEQAKLMLVPVHSEERYYEGHVFHVPPMGKHPGGPHVLRYIQLAHDAAASGLDGVVIGAPSPRNHITNQELDDVQYYLGRQHMLILLPGVGAQGGEAQAIWRYFFKDRVIVNVGRGLMFPGTGYNEARTGGWAATARRYQEMLNTARNTTR